MTISAPITPIDLLLWVVFPYITITVFWVGIVWRYKTDKYGWTSRSSQMYSGGSMIRWASPLFHVGILMVLVGHFVGLMIPKTWTGAVGISDNFYHLLAVGGGMTGGIMAVLGLVLLIYRRRTTGGVFLATSANDKLMYVLLAVPIFLGFIAVVINQIVPGGHGYDYRETISPWLRSLFIFQPRPELMVDVPLSFQLHVISAFLLFAVLPFTRLVHVFSAPVGYTTRPYIVYRGREAANAVRRPDRGWEPIVGPVSLQDSESTGIRSEAQDMRQEHEHRHSS